VAGQASKVNGRFRKKGEDYEDFVIFGSKQDAERVRILEIRGI